MTDRVLRDFELVLMTKHRFALADVIVCMQSTVQDFHEVESSLTVASASVLSYGDSDKRSADVLDRVSCQLERLVGITPMFLGEQELTMFMNALRDFGRLSESLETDIMSFKTLLGFLLILNYSNKLLVSALKLQFRETLDQELFLAYVDDWNAERNALQSTERSNEYRVATNHLQELKTAIGRAHELVQTSKEKLILDDPTRTALVQEVTQIFNDEGGAFTCMDALR
ncbi:hypothetical protein BBJ29_003737 [Phytophthora kernoviae]|uniref:Uncharacterized protein n=1 Tax=Phytophthora kernoviae TaxID=325452 RepID=A0A3F2RKP5_9STRA|nr:hypothetical protein BBP00_00006603 [Phytophthora kernoviae]RLN71782.1 hypothetical protein BBJ29_003737 [Phytophthora kernoviae]